MTKRILVVEDQDEVSCGTSSRVLATLSSKRQMGRPALPWPNPIRPSIILIDIQMPVIDGYEATRQIKANPDLTSIPVVAISSFAMKGDEEKARQAGCDD